ncbi:putative phosphoribosyltransferase [Pseudomonas migulae]|uniref:phosphoribosyltransferase n=1 Tax=Pseudomonas migulae TaxID=78543 RepID=UPI00209F961A|nr:phosphoribosyltransferase family protein [Pseudomonas migulae]MCP1501213.1 putative phosphoribosyltransferase [Pseudomonas migulae]
MNPSSPTVLQDRADAGRRLVAPLLKYAHRADVIVLALPRGGVPVAYEVASALDVRLDLMLVRKLGVPTHQELAMGAIASGGIQILNEHALRAHPIDQATFDAVVARETRELLRREQAYRGTRAQVALKDQVVILIDDGLATGASMKAAIQAARVQRPARIVVAVPVAPVETAEALRREVDELVCPVTAEWFMSIGHWYMDFSQTPDAEVIRLLQRAWQKEASDAGQRSGQE